MINRWSMMSGRYHDGGWRECTTGLLGIFKYKPFSLCYTALEVPGATEYETLNCLSSLAPASP